MGERFGSGNNEVTIATDGSNGFPGEHVAIGTRRQLLAQDHFCVAPGFESYRAARCGVELSEEPAGQNQDCGFAEGPGERHQVLVSNACGA